MRVDRQTDTKIDDEALSGSTRHPSILCTHFTRKVNKSVASICLSAYPSVRLFVEIPLCPLNRLTVKLEFVCVCVEGGS